KKEAFHMFDQLMGSIQAAAAARIFRAQLAQQAPVSIDLSKAKTRKDSINESLSKEVADATLPIAQPTSVKSENSFAAALQTAKGGRKPTPGAKAAKIGRNDLCPCGSGLKYKKCGLINAPSHR